MDDIDRKIIRHLQEEPKLTMKELAQKVSISTSPVFERVKRLEKNGVIKYKVIADREKLGYGLSVFCQVSLNTHDIDAIKQFEEHVNNLDEVMDCYHTAGSFDYLLRVIVKDMDDYQKFLVEKLSATKVMSNIQSVFVLGEKKNTLIVPVK